MKIENLLFWVIVLSMLGYSCSKEIPPAFLSGKYKAFKYVVQDCKDTFQNVDVDFSDPNTVYKLNCVIDTINCDTIIELDSIFIRIETTTDIGVDTVYFEVDSTKMDTSIFIMCDTIHSNCDFYKYNEVTFEIDGVGSYELLLDVVKNGVPMVEQTQGTYISNGFSDVNFCFTDCLDSMWYPGVYVEEGLILNLSWRDTLITSCGILFQGDKIE